MGSGAPEDPAAVDPAFAVVAGKICPMSAADCDPWKKVKILEPEPNRLCFG